MAREQSAWEQLRSPLFLYLALYFSCLVFMIRFYQGSAFDQLSDNNGDETAAAAGSQSAVDEDSSVDDYLQMFNVIVSLGVCFLPVHSVLVKRGGHAFGFAATSCALPARICYPKI